MDELTSRLRVSTLEEAETIIHLASVYFENAWVLVSREQARDLILQAAELLRQEDHDG